jgi:hypothetical protein
MEKFKVHEITGDSIIFTSISEMEKAYNQLADGKDIIIYKENKGEKKAEILAGKTFSEIIEGKIKLSSKEQT